MVDLSASMVDSIGDKAAASAIAIAAVLPSAEPLIAGNPTPLSQIVLPENPGGAVLMRFTGTTQGELVLIVNRDLVEALSSTSLGELNLAAAVQPALDAAAESLGASMHEPANAVDLDSTLSALAARSDALAVPLLAGSEVGAVMVLSASGNSHPTSKQSMMDASRRAGLELLRDVEMEVTAELGRTRMTVKELLSLAPGTVVELDRAAGSPADLLVNGRLIARGEVVVVDEDFGIRITEIVVPAAEALG